MDGRITNRGDHGGETLGALVGGSQGEARRATVMTRMALVLISIFAFLTPSAAAADESLEQGHQLGFSLGTPAGLNAEYAYEFGRRAISLSGGFYGVDFLGVQAGLTLERSGNARKAFSVNLVGGHIFVRDSNKSQPKRLSWSYGGLETNLRYRRLFLAPVLSFGGGWREDPYHRQLGNPVLLVRLGMIWPL